MPSVGKLVHLDLQRQLYLTQLPALAIDKERNHIATRVGHEGKRGSNNKKGKKKELKGNDIDEELKRFLW